MIVTLTILAIISVLAAIFSFIIGIAIPGSREEAISLKIEIVMFLLFAIFLLLLAVVVKFVW